MEATPGLVVLFGSGETSASGRRVFDWVFAQSPMAPRVAVLETPAGFEPNSDRVADREAEFIREHLQPYQPEVVVIPARQRGTPFSPDDPALLAPLLTASVIFLGPGSPTYAVRQLRGSLAWQYLLARHRLGAAVVLASAAAVAASRYSLPVYEIYKVGLDLHWQDGLDFFGAFGLALTFVPHWDNAEGGEELDTSRCFMGEARFRRLLGMLPEALVIGIDEHTALAFDLAAEVCQVMGRGGVTIIRDGKEARFVSGQAFPITELGSFHAAATDPGVASAMALSLATQAVPSVTGPPAEVRELVEAREEARRRRDWALADALRQRIASLGWQVADTRKGPVLREDRPR